MANQRVIVAKIVGNAARESLKRFEEWPAYDSSEDEDATECPEVDEFIARMRENAHLPPIVYHIEWIDMWSMGDLLPGLGNTSARVVYGRRFQISLHVPPVTVGRHIIGRTLTQECKWLRARIREAEDAWKPLAAEAVIVVAREPLGGLVTDEELEASLRRVPDWLTE